MNATTNHEALALVPGQAQPLATQQGGALAASSPAGMMMAMMERGASLDQIRQMMDIQERWEAAEAKKAYNAAFAAFKAEAIAILKNKRVSYRNNKGSITEYDHAELSDVVEAVTPALSRHGLSASWSISEQRKDWIEITCTLKHALGYFETAKMGGPPDDSGGKNAIQAISSAKTYLERQTLKAVCGVSEKGVDNDGRGATGPGPITEKILDGLIADLKLTKTDEQASALWASGSKTLAATESKEAYDEFKQAVVAHRRALKEAKQ